MNGMGLRLGLLGIVCLRTADRTLSAVLLLAATLVVSACCAQTPPSNPAEAYRIRRAPHPKAAAIQTDFSLASATMVDFKVASELRYKPFNELVLQTGTFPNGNAVSGLPDAFELLCYNGESVGPTIRLRRGATFHIRLKNNLPGPVIPSSHATSGDNEQPHDLCTTNLHTHGLHVSPGGIADNVFVDVEPQKEFTFEFTVPIDHPSGTFWYHPHRHGSVAYQLSNGLSGALIVDGTPGDNIADLEDVAGIKGVEERILIFQLYEYRVDPAGPTGVGRIDAKVLYNGVPPDARSCPAIAVPDTNPTSQGEVTAINGVIDPVMRLQPGEVQRWRLIHAGWDVNRRLYLVDAAQQPAADMQFHEIAVDGLATGLLDAKGNDPTAATPTVEIAPGQRSDVLIKAPDLAAGETERIYFLMQSGRDLAGPGGTPLSEDKILAKIIVSGAVKNMPLPDPAELVKCKPFADVEDGELATTDISEIAVKGLKFSATAAPSNKRWINNKTYGQYATPVQIRIGSAEQWKVSAGGQNHPFHIHVNAFQVLKRIDPSGAITPMNVWRDTLFLEEGHSYIIRSRFADFLGKTVIHCHFLDHEDQGMMMPIEFIPPYQKPVAATFVQADRLVPTQVEAPGLALVDVNGIQHDLKNFRQRNVVLIFFLGIECSHCSQQLLTFVRESAKEFGPDTEIVAVSSQPVPGVGLLPTDLQLKGGDRFTLLIDDSQDVFRAFGAYKDGPLHGLYVIDGAGTIRGAYSGPIPFDDVSVVGDMLKSLPPATVATTP